MRWQKQIRFNRVAFRCIDDYDLALDVNKTLYDKHIRNTIDKNDKVVITYFLEDDHRSYGFWYKGSEELR